MRRIIFCLIIAVCCFGSGKSFAEKEGGNGGGVAEKYILSAYDQMPGYIEFFLAVSPSTPLEYKTLLKSIVDSYSQERLTPNQIQFESGKKKCGNNNHCKFIVDDQIRVAVTNDSVGGVIFVNTDLLYSKDRSHKDVSISFPTALAILVHEFGHHHGIKDCSFLDRLGAKVAETIVQNTLSAMTLTDDGSLKADYLTATIPLEYLSPSEQQIIISTKDDVFFLTIHPGEMKVGCPDHSRPFNFYFTNLGWSNQVDPALNKDGNIYHLFARGVFFCFFDFDNEKRSSVAATLSFSVPYRGHTKEARLEVLDCQRHPDRCW